MNRLPIETMPGSSIRHNETNSPRKRGRGPGRRKPVAEERNALYGLRKLFDLTTRDLGIILGCGQSAITRAEQHGVTTKAAFMQNLAELMEVAVWRLLNPSLSEEIARDPDKVARIRERIERLHLSPDRIILPRFS